MIGYLEGKVLFSDGFESIILTSSGVGHQVFYNQVLIEGQTAEIYISHIVRERFKLKDKIRTISAEGRLAAGMLIAIPLLVIFVFFIINRDYISIFINHPTGRLLGIFTVIMVGLGIAVIRKMINFEV